MNALPELVWMLGIFPFLYREEPFMVSCCNKRLQRLFHLYKTKRDKMLHYISGSRSNRTFTSIMFMTPPSVCVSDIRVCYENENADDDDNYDNNERDISFLSITFNRLRLAALRTSIPFQPHFYVKEISTTSDDKPKIKIQYIFKGLSEFPGNTRIVLVCRDRHKALKLSDWKLGFRLCNRQNDSPGFVHLVSPRYSIHEGRQALFVQAYYVNCLMWCYIYCPSEPVFSLRLRMPKGVAYVKYLTSYEAVVSHRSMTMEECVASILQFFAMPLPPLCSRWAYQVAIHCLARHNPLTTVRICLDRISQYDRSIVPTRNYNRQGRMKRVFCQVKRA
eukprot:GILJ01027473.1.p1 GENE.GILJ01027473.1~~GILJ01027473.1.p1  ORF type:complete len:334 (-),score=1.67 GILJ01027473.1:721-1722(-)